MTQSDSTPAGLPQDHGPDLIVIRHRWARPSFAVDLEYRLPILWARGVSRASSVDAVTRTFLLDEYELMLPVSTSGNSTASYGGEHDRAQLYEDVKSSGEFVAVARHELGVLIAAGDLLALARNVAAMPRFDGYGRVRIGSTSIDWYFVRQSEAGQFLATLPSPSTAAIPITEALSAGRPTTIRYTRRLPG